MEQQEALLLEAQSVLSKIENDFNREKAEAHILLGRVEAFNFAKRFLEFGELKTIEKIKEKKAYKGLLVIDKNTGEEKRISTFKEFCQHLGISYETVNNHLNYLRDLGEPLYKESLRLGVSDREMRRLRKLPDETLIDIAKIDFSEDEDKSRLVEKLAEAEKMIEKLSDTIEEQVEQLADTVQKLDKKTEDYEAQSRVLENKDKHINRISTDLAKRQRLIEEMTPDEIGEELRTEVDAIAYSIKASLIARLKPAFEQLEEHQNKTGVNHQQFMTGLIADLKCELSQIQTYFKLNNVADGDNTPEWARNNYTPEDYSEKLDELYGKDS